MQEKRSYWIGVLVGVTITIAVAQAGWTRTYGWEESVEKGMCVHETQDGNYIVVGSRGCVGDSSADIWLLKVNPSGDTLWTKSYGDGVDYGYSVQETQDKGYIMGTSLGVIKTDSNGEVEWTAPYPTTCIEKTTDGCYILACNKGQSGWLVKINAQGDTLWTKEYTEDYPSSINFVRQTSDGGYLVAGHQTEIGLTAYLLDYAWFFKTDSMGNKGWSYLIQGDAMTSGYSASQTRDGGYVLAGDHVGWAATTSFLLLVKIDSAGNESWRYDRDSENKKENHAAYDVVPTSDSGCIITGGYWYSFMKLDMKGSIEWKRIYDLDGRSISETGDGGYVAVGSGGSGGGDLSIVKIDSKGDTLGIIEEDPVTPITHHDFEIANPIGSQIIIRFTNLAKNNTALNIFDASGRKVDEVHATDASGAIAWGEGMSPGVYFVRVPDGAVKKNTLRVVLLP